MYSLVIVLVLLLSGTGCSLNILVVFNFNSKSTTFGSFLQLFKGLTSKGHNLTVISPLRQNEVIPNFNEIIIDTDRTFKLGTDNISFIAANWRKNMYIGPMMLSSLAEQSCEDLFMTKAVQDLYKNNSPFDLVLIHLFQSECLYSLADKFHAPIIGLHSHEIMPWVSDRFGIPQNPAIVPCPFLSFSPKMTFFQRLESSIHTWLILLYHNLVMVPNDKEIIKKHFGSKEAEHLDNLIYNTSLILVITHFSVNTQRALVPNVIEVGGIHIEKPKSLPKNLEKWIKESPHGVIYFSFGSLVKGYTMPADKRQAFINAFKRLPQRVIWKWENDTMEGKSDNIMIGKWLPQFDILSHPNVKAFISHGGLLGTFEAVHCGVPILVMPQFGDQHTNAKAIESVGGGEILYLSDATEEKIYNALTKTLSPSFQQQAKELSERFRDRPMPPLETAIYWVEYVARHKGAHFMKTAAVGMPFYQYYLLDVIAFLLAVLILFLYLVYLVLRFFVRLVFKPKQPTKVKKS